LNIQHIGSEYGGWPVDLDSVPPRSTVISGGIGTDASFDKGIIKLKQCSVVGIDPTKKSHDYIEQENINGLTLVKAALTGERKTKEIKIYKQKNPDYVSESILSSNENCSSEYHLSNTVGIEEILSRYSDISILKLDIEGAEYEVIDSLPEIEIPQLCIEFHHFCTDFSEEDTRNALQKLFKLGYTHQLSANGREYLLIHKNQ
jgi:FkbM family methyltransferase